MSDLREALKTLRDANMSYSLVSDVKNARRLEQAMRDAEAALAQPEAVEPVMRSLTNDEHLLVVQSLIDSSSTTPLAPYERMRRALERIKNRCNSTENAYVLLADIFNEANEALVHAGEGKESDGATQDTETIHQTIYKHAYKSLKGRVSERFLQEEFWLATEDAAKEIALTPPDATAQREAIARIIDPEAFENWDRAEGSWRKDEARVKCEDAEAKADAILALNNRAGG